MFLNLFGNVILYRMPSFFNINLPLPKKSKFNLSHDHASSHCIGTLDPVLCEYLPTDTDVDISVQNVVRTSPTICPVFGSLRQDYHFFFVPLRLFVPAMRMNNLESETSSLFVDTDLPRWAPNGTAPATGVTPNIHVTSLLARLGYGCNSTGGSDSVTETPINPIPYWSYYSIFYNYYANRQVASVRGYVNYGATYLPDNVTTPSLHSNLPLDTIRASLLSAQNTMSVTSGNELSQQYAYLYSNYFRGGLMCRSRESDLFTTFVSNESVSAARSFSKITPAADGSITFDQIRTSSALTGFVERLILAGGRYLDWLTVTSGVKTSHKCDIPEYIGSTSGSIIFDMITNVSGQDFGQLGGRGQGGVSGRRHRFTNVEPGFLICIYSIIPHVLYPGSVKPWVFSGHLSDLYNTSLDRLSWQDLPFRCVDSSVRVSDSANTGWSSSVSLGKQPAWFEETSVPSRSTGLLASTLRYWTFTPAPLSNTDASTQIGAYSLPYCIPDFYQYIFEAPKQDNFFVYHQFRFFARKQKSKNALPRVL